MLSWCLLFLCALSSQPTVTEGTAVQITTFTPKNTQKNTKSQSVSLKAQMESQQNVTVCLPVPLKWLLFVVFIFFLLFFWFVFVEFTCTLRWRRLWKVKLSVWWCRDVHQREVLVFSFSLDLKTLLIVRSTWVFPCKINQIWGKKISSNSFRIGRFLNLHWLWCI